MNVGLNQISNPFVKGMASANDFSIQKMNGINYYSVAFILFLLSMLLLVLVL